MFVFRFNRHKKSLLSFTCHHWCTFELYKELSGYCYIQLQAGLSTVRPRACVMFNSASSSRTNMI